MSRTFRTRLPHSLDEQLTQMCEGTRMPVSAAIRACVRYCLDHPEAWAIFQRYSPVDTRTPEAVAAYARYEKELESFDMQAIARELGMV